MPSLLEHIKENVDKNKYDSINLYFQDESRFGLMTAVGRCLSIRGLRPRVKFQQRFSNTYLWGSYSPITGDQFVWEVNGVDSQIFDAYLKAFSAYKPREFKVIIIDNAGFHSTKHLEIPDNIALINIPPYCPELNPAEQVWQYIKKRYKNKTFSTMKDLREWLHRMVKGMDNNLIKSITSNHHYQNIVNSVL